PVVMTEDVKDDYINPDVSLPGIPKRLKLKCHMLSLVGHRQNDDAGITAVGLYLDLYRSDAAGRPRKTFLEEGSKFGETKIGTVPGRSFPISPVQLSHLPDWLSR